MCHFYRVESQLYRDGKSRNLRRKMTKLWHFEPTRGEKLKAEKKSVEVLHYSFGRK